MTFFNSKGQIQVQWQKLSVIDAQYVKNDRKLAISRQYPEFLKIPGRFQKWWNFETLYWKSSFLTQTEWVIPYMLISNKTSQFQSTSGILESWIPHSRNHNISPNVCKINTNMLLSLFEDYGQGFWMNFKVCNTISK